MLLAAAASATAPQRIAVFGGSGFVGTAVCKALVSRGCSVLSISRRGLRTPGRIRWNGDTPTMAEQYQGEEWLNQVDWVEVDATDKHAVDAALEGEAISGCVGCLGSPELLRMSKSSWNGNLWSEESFRLCRETFAPNESCFGAAAAAGARRCAFMGVSSDAERAYGGTNAGAFKGKRDAAATALAAFDDGLVYFAPHLVVPAGDARLKALDSGWARGLIGLNRAIGEVGYRGEDFVTRVGLTPPISVDELATAIAATVTGAVEVEESERLVIVNEGGRDAEQELSIVGRHVDGTSAIRRIARLAEAERATV